MSEWLDASYKLLLNLFSRTTPGESGVVAGLCIFLGALALSRTATALGAIKAFYKISVLLIVAGTALLLLTMAAPMALGLDPVWMPVTAAGCVLLLIIVPFTRLVLKGGYIASLVAWTVTLLTVGAILSLEPLAMERFKHWDRSMQIEKNRVEKGWQK